MPRPRKKNFIVSYCDGEVYTAGLVGSVHDKPRVDTYVYKDLSNMVIVNIYVYERNIWQALRAAEKKYKEL